VASEIRVRIYLELLWFRLLRMAFMLLPNPMRIRVLRSQGVKIGRDCLVHTPYFGVEPYLVEIGDHVAISSGTEFITHDAVGWMFQDQQNWGLYGAIRVGSNTFFGLNCTVLPGTTIGADCVIGAGSVVRGNIPDGSVVMGNPARVVMTTALLKQLSLHHRNRVDTHLLSSREKRRRLLKHFGME
jgi:acetyltransferase-like isoleucine patch superfamily enzyme